MKDVSHFDIHYYFWFFKKNPARKNYEQDF